MLIGSTLTVLIVLSTFASIQLFKWGARDPYSSYGLWLFLNPFITITLALIFVQIYKWFDLI